jgi:hypothetical protein
VVLVLKTAIAILPVLVISGITLGLLASIELGYRFGTRRWTRSPTLPREVSSTVQASVFGLMGLLIAFIFYGAGARFDNRGTLVAEEANAIGTAYLRLDLLPQESQPRLREDFRAYLGARLDVNRDVPDMKAVDADLKRSSMLQQKIWKETVEALKESGPSTQTLVGAESNDRHHDDQNCWLHRAFANPGFCAACRHGSHLLVLDWLLHVNVRKPGLDTRHHIHTCGR